MKYAVLASLIFLTACAGSQRQTPVIVADGTEAEQLVQLFFCGDSEGFAKAIGGVDSKLRGAWDQIEGENSPHECTVRINIDKNGHIVGHEVVTCDKPSAISALLVAASPVPVPANQCMFDRINEMKFELNSGSDSNS
ncbi:hypothetical protein [Microbulbifer sp. PSTR4-B]|uniref:hypothetical protein n=1 Tax=Microbulbifer sp. PSTR4-B TaxID=3243396 RepID=UPI0040396AF3